MSWLQIKCVLPSENVEAVEFILEASGALSVTCTDAEDQPILEPALGTTPLWDLTEITGLYAEGTQAAPVVSLLCEQLPQLRPDQIHSEILEDQDWTRAWMAGFKPMPFGETLAVCPTGFEPIPNRINLLLDPGLAFGTGTHPTTHLCLEWLDGLAAQGKLKDAVVVDYGCGSGILAIAAALLGAKHVIAVDNDPQALISTNDNAHRNNVTSKITTLLPEAVDTDNLQADVMVANILANPLIELSGLLLSLTKPSGAIGLSGILHDQAESVRAAYAGGTQSLQIKQLEDWVRIDGTLV